MRVLSNLAIPWTETDLLYCLSSKTNGDYPSLPSCLLKSLSNYYDYSFTNNFQIAKFILDSQKSLYILAVLVAIRFISFIKVTLTKALIQKI